MAPSRRTLSIALALLISASFITAGYALSSDVSTLTVGATSTEELMREYAKKDTDADGLPDWKESLYGADPANPRSLDPSMTDKEAVDGGKVEPKFRSAAPREAKYEITDEDFTVAAPEKGSVTDEFARAFFEDYINSIDGEIAAGTPDEDYILSLTDSVGARVSTKLSSSFGEQQVVTGPSGSEAAYLLGVGAALDYAGNTGEDDPIALTDRLINKGDERAAAELLVVADAYRTSADALRTLPTPSSLVSAQVRLVRALEQVAGASELVASFATDPLATVGALAVFEPAFKEIYLALYDIHTVGVQKGIGSGPGMPGEKVHGYMSLLAGLATP